MKFDRSCTLMNVPHCNGFRTYRAVVQWYAVESPGFVARRGKD